MPTAIRSWALALIVLGAVLAPLALVRHLPFTDLPNHLARHWLAAHLATTPELQPYWSFDDALLPNSGGDILRAALGWTGDVALFGRISVAVALANLVAGLMVLHRALWGRWSALPLVGALGAWNGLLWFGFENFCHALPFVMHGLAAWLGLRARSLPLAALLLALLAAATYLAHVVAFGLLAFAVLLAEAGRCPRSGAGLAAAALACLPPVLHFALAVAAQGAGHGSEIAYGSVIERLTILVAPVSRLTNWDPLTAEFILTASILGALTYGSLEMRRRGWLRLHPALTWPLAGLAVLCLALPETVMGIEVMQIRAPVILFLLGAAGMDWANCPGKVRAGVGAAAAALIGAQSLLNSLILLEHDRAAREFVAAASVIAPGDRVMATSREAAGWLAGVIHMHALAVPERRAFIPNLFHGANGVVVAPAWRHASHPHIGLVPPSLLREALREHRAGRDYRHPGVVNTFWRTWWRDFTHLVEFTRSPGPNAFPGLLVEEARGSFFVIWRVVPPPE